MKRSGGSSGRRLGQLPKGTEGGAPKGYGKEQNNANLHNEKHMVGHNLEILPMQGTINHRSASDEVSTHGLPNRAISNDLE